MNNFRYPMNSREFREAAYTGRGINGPMNDFQSRPRPPVPNFSYRAGTRSSRFDVGPHGEQSRVASLPQPLFPSQNSSSSKRPEEYFNGAPHFHSQNPPNLFSMGQTSILAAQQITTFAKTLDRIESRFPSVQRQNHNHQHRSSHIRDKPTAVKRVSDSRPELRHKVSRFGDAKRLSTSDNKRPGDRSEKSKPSISSKTTASSSSKTGSFTSKSTEVAIKSTPSSQTSASKANTPSTNTPKQAVKEKIHAVLYVRRSDGFAIDSKTADYIQDSLIDLIYGDESGQPPTFNDSGLSDESQFKVTCVDERSASWLKKNASRIPAFNGITFTATEKQTLHKYKVFFNRKKLADLSTILSRLKRSNHDLMVDCWSSQLDKESEDGVAFIFGLDQKSVDALKARAFEPFFELSKIKFELVLNQPCPAVAPYIPGGSKDKPEETLSTVKSESSTPRRSNRSPRY